MKYNLIFEIFKEAKSGNKPRLLNLSAVCIEMKPPFSFHNTNVSSKSLSPEKHHISNHRNQKMLKTIDI